MYSFEWKSSKSLQEIIQHYEIRLYMYMSYMELVNPSYQYRHFLFSFKGKR